MEPIAYEHVMLFIMFPCDANMLHVMQCNFAACVGGTMDLGHLSNELENWVHSVIHAAAAIGLFDQLCR